MEQPSVRRHGNNMAKRPRTTAEVNVVVRDGARRVEALQLLEQLSSDHQAGCADGWHTPHLDWNVALAASEMLPDPVGVADHAGVLYRAVRIEQRRTGNADSWLTSDAD